MTKKPGKSVGTTTRGKQLSAYIAGTRGRNLPPEIV